MGQGASIDLTEEEQQKLQEDLGKLYDKIMAEQGKKILNDEEEAEMQKTLQTAYKKMVIDLKRDEYLALHARK
eukprot:CAMPEP_0117790236 /NCGR_PEP_ID=MMETSP0948-20121206/8121_1 /TAXON_ID=44440 /ORGANISM="Chattonella subsalsa, Strain CCMP2191" /LENGTH=72 /DNA_ID=CAMNT_0005620019 /DNA_START=151 /DNA_END=369 /DNA_ORIENTATION=-